MMKPIRPDSPVCTMGELCTPVEEMPLLLAEHCGQRAERYRAAAQGYVDDKLREIFPALRGRSRAAAGQLPHKHEQELVERVIRWAGLPEGENHTRLSKLGDPAHAPGPENRSPQS